MTKYLSTATAIATAALLLTITPSYANSSAPDGPGGKATVVRLQTVPGATCSLHAGSATESDESLPLYADDDGVIEVYVLMEAGTDNIDPEYLLDCVGDNGVRSAQSGHVRAAAAATARLASVAQKRSEKKVIAIRPALSGDPKSLSQNELRAQGYPPRPDPIGEPASYEKWLEMVSTPTKLVSPRVVQTPVHNNTASQSWCGYALDQPNTKYYNVGGYLTVPAVTLPSCSNCSTWSSFWTGLDGLNSSDIVQAGTEMQAVKFWWGSFTSYYSWREWYPGHEASISNFPTHPGDQIYVHVWIGDVGGNGNPNGGYAWFYLQNLTYNYYYQDRMTPPNGAHFVGSSAEWIMERPTVNGTIQRLSKFGSAGIMGAGAFTGNDGNVHTVDTDQHVVYDMYDGQYLACVSSGSGTWLSYFWINY